MNIKIKRKLLVFFFALFLLNLSAQQICFDGNYCPYPGNLTLANGTVPPANTTDNACMTGGTDEYMSPLAEGAPDPGVDGNAGGTCDILYYLIAAEGDFVYLGIQQGNQGTATYQFFFDTDGDPTTGAPGTVGVDPETGAELSLTFGVTQNGINGQEVGLWDGSDFQDTGTNSIQGMAGTLDGCGGSENSFLEVQILVGDLIDPCSPDNSGVLTLVGGQTFAGGSTNSAVCDFLLGAIETNIPAPPVGDLAPADPICLGETITFDASGSTGGNPLDYMWDFDGDGVIDLTTQTPFVDFTYTDPGTYTVSVTVANPAVDCPPSGNETATIMVEVIPALVVEATATLDPCTLTLTFDASGTMDLLTQGNLVITWDFGDGTISNDVSGTYTYSDCSAISQVMVSAADPDLGTNNDCSNSELSFPLNFSNAPPTITCPADATILCTDPVVIFTTLEEFLAGGGVAMDDCGIVDFTFVEVVIDDPQCPLIKESQITYTVTDICGLTASCTQVIGATGEQPLFTSCPPDITIACGPLDTMTLGSPTISTGACVFDGSITFSDDTQTGACPSETVITRTFTVTDECGNTDVCTQVITIPFVDAVGTVDFDPCALTVNFDASGTIDLLTQGNLVIEWDFGDGNTSTDVSGTYTYTNCNLITQVVLTVTEPDLTCTPCGVSILAFPLNFTNVPPTIVCPASVDIPCGDSPNIPLSLADFIAAGGTVTDECDIADFEAVVVESNAVACPYIGSTTVTYTVTDHCGLTASCTQVFNVIGEAVQILSCPPDVEIGCQATDTMTLGAPVISVGACVFDAMITFEDNVSSGPCPSATVITRTFTVTDECQNEVQCVQTITTPFVEAIGSVDFDSCTLELIFDASGTLDPLTLGDLNIEWDFGDGNSTTDVTGSYTFTDCSAIGSVTLTVSDPELACSDCGTDVLILPLNFVNTVPIINCPPDIEILCGAEVPVYTTVDDFIDAGGVIVDDCEVTDISVVSIDSTNILQCPFLGFVDVTYEIGDVCGNTANCTQRISLIASTPNIVCPPSLELSCIASIDTSNTGAPIFDSGACILGAQIEFVDEVIPGACSSEVTINRTFTVTDDCGNTTTCIQIINVIDDQAPNLVCPPSVTIDCTQAFDISVTGFATATDPCGPFDGSDPEISITYNDEIVKPEDLTDGCLEIQRTFTAVDECGNTASCTQSIFIEPGDESNALACNDRINYSLTQDCSGITPDALLEAPGGPGLYVIELFDGTLGWAEGPNMPFEGINWGDYVNSGEPIVYQITDFCCNTCWGEVLLEAVLLPEFDVPCQYVQGSSITSNGNITQTLEGDDILLNDLGITKDLVKTADLLGSLTLNDISCQIPTISGATRFRYNDGPHGGPAIWIDDQVQIYFIDATSGELIQSYTFAEGTIQETELTDLIETSYLVYISSSSSEATGTYTIDIDFPFCAPSCVTTCGNEIPMDIVSVEDILETLSSGCYANLVNDIVIEETREGDLCDGILHVITYYGFFQMHSEVNKIELFSQAYLEEKIDLNNTDILVEPLLEIDCDLPYDPESIAVITEDVGMAYPFYYDFDNPIQDTVCLESVEVHYEVPVDTVQEMVLLNGQWILLNVVKKELRDSMVCTSYGPSPEITYPKITLQGELCNILVSHTDEVIPACNGGAKIFRSWEILDWCDGFTRRNLTQFIEQIDKTPPILKGIDDVNLTIEPWTCGVNLRLPDLTIEDNCSTEFIANYNSPYGTIEDGHLANLTLDQSPIPVYLSVKDDCDNVTLDTFMVFLEDNIPPVSVCVDRLSITLTEGVGKIEASSFDAGSHDAGCGPVTIKVRRMEGCCGDECVGEEVCIETDPKTGECLATEIQNNVDAAGDYVKFCCEDIGKTIIVVVEITDHVGNTNFCMVPTDVSDKNTTFLVCEDYTISCTGDVNEAPVPEILAICEIYEPQIWHETETMQNCGYGTIIREWYIDVDGSGDLSSNDAYCEQTITIVPDEGGFDPYTIKWPKHYNGTTHSGVNLECDDDGNLTTTDVSQIDMGVSFACISEDVSLKPFWCETSCGLIGYSLDVDTLRSVDACTKIVKRWTVIDWCTWESNQDNIDDENDTSNDQFIAVEDWAQGVCQECASTQAVYGDPVYFAYQQVDLDGYYTFDQILKIDDQDDPVISVVDFVEVQTTGGATSKDDDAPCFGSDVVTATAQDFCNGLSVSGANLRWTASVLQNGVTISTSEGAGNEFEVNTEVGSPGLDHQILWTVSDGCGNSATAITEISFQDLKPPTPFCIAGLSTVAMENSNGVPVWASDFDFGSFDNCTPASELRFSIVPSGQTPIRPGEPDFGTEASITYDCDNVNEQNALDIWVWDASGNGDFCTASIFITGDVLNDAEVACEEITISCIDDVDAIAQPNITSACDIFQASVLFDNVETQDCGFGTIRREWYVDLNDDGIFNTGEPYCEQIINVVPTDETFDPTTIKWPAHHTGRTNRGSVLTCGANNTILEIPDQSITLYDEESCSLQNDNARPVWCESPCGLVSASSILDTVSVGGCTEIQKIWTVIDWCTWVDGTEDVNQSDDFTLIQDNTEGACEDCRTNEAFAELIFFRYNDADLDGIYSFAQRFTILDEEGPTINVDSNTTIEGDDNCEGTASFTASASDFCNGSEITNAILHWEVELRSADGGLKEREQATGETVTFTFDRLETGYVLNWTVTDQCRNTSSAVTNITIEDNSPPTLDCPNSITSVVVDEATETGILEIGDVLFSAEEFCSNESALSIALIPSGATPILPGQEGFDTQTTINFGCDDLGQTYMYQIMVWDASGNMNSCSFDVFVEGNCGSTGEGSTGMISGTITNDRDQAVSQVQVQLNANLPEYPLTKINQEDGSYSFSNILHKSTYAVTPKKDIGDENGVSTLDILLIQRHILDLDPFESPYKMIASDANSDGKIAASDIIDIRKVILGIFDAFPNNDSWRFVKKEFEFDPNNSPFPFLEVLDIHSFEGDLFDEDFIAVKIGDVNDSSIANEFDDVVVRSHTEKLTLKYKDQLVQKGQIVKLDMYSEEYDEISGFQFTLNHTGLKLLDIEAKALGVQKDHVGLIDNDLMTMSYNDLNPESFEGQTLFTFAFEAQSNGLISSMLDLNSNIAEAEAYSTAAFTPIGLQFVADSDLVHKQTLLFQNAPNPFSDQTEISFYLDQKGEVEFHIVDTQGRIVWQLNKQFEQGKQSIIIDQTAIELHGVFYYTMKTSTGQWTKKMVVIQ